MNPLEERTELLRELKRDYAGCERCAISVCSPYKATAWGTVRNPHLFIIEDVPSLEQVEKSAIAAPPSRELLFSMLSMLHKGAPKEAAHAQFGVWITNLLLCSPVYQNDQGQIEERQPTTEEINNCMSRIFDEILLTDPTVLVLFGPLPYKHIAKAKTKFQTAIGEIITVRFTHRGVPYSYPAMICPAMTTLLRTDAKARQDGPTYLTVSLLARAIQLAQFIAYLRAHPAAALHEAPPPPCLDAGIDKTPALTVAKKTRQR